MDPRREALKVFSEIVERVGQKGLVDGEIEAVRHLAYAKDTPPKYAIRPTARALRAYSIQGIDTGS